MAGYADMNIAKVWVQLDEAATVQLEYWPQDSARYKRTTEAATTTRPDFFTATLVARGLSAGTTYRYSVLIDGKAASDERYTFSTPEHWHWRTDPPAFSIAMGSCSFWSGSDCDRPGDPYGGEYQIFDAIAQKSPELMLWLGDNIYLRECDWTSREGIFKRYSYVRQRPELQKLLKSTQHIAIWDDHDYGPNNSDRSYILKDAATEAFRAFWANPGYGLPGQGGITTSFEWGDVQFFLLDNRYFRSNNRRTTGQRTMIGEAQFQWLIDALKKSRANFKIVAIGGQVLNPVPKYENWAGVFPEERERLLQTLRRERIEGVVFIDGDRHHSEITRMPMPEFYPLYDFTISPLTSSAHDATSEANHFRVEGSMIVRRNFATFSFSGPFNDRKLTVTYYDSDGNQLLEHEIRAQDLTLD